MLKDVSALKELFSGGWESYPTALFLVLVIKYFLNYLSQREARALEKFQSIQDHEFRMSALVDRLESKAINKEINDAD